MTVALIDLLFPAAGDDFDRSKTSVMLMMAKVQLLILIVILVIMRLNSIVRTR